MHNPNSAVERIKNHLAYKLGQAMIEYNKNGGGYLSLFKKLYNIKKQHKKEKQIYQETIKVFPTLKYPELKQCPDYNEALKCYFHLSYMLGEALIKSYQSWYRGGGFKLYSYIKKAKKEFKLFQDIFKEFDQINSNTIEGIAKNKQLFLKEFPKIKNLLNTHKDYKPIIDNIFHNFDYVIKKINLIEEWLLSNDFNEKYKKENHPYPSLLDPKKLNDEKEEINYKTIPAELAWEMNLPLPDNYEFVLISGHANAAGPFMGCLKKCNINIPWFGYIQGVQRYIFYFNFLISNINRYNALHWGEVLKKFPDNYKLAALIAKDCYYLIFFRDPISIFTSCLGYEFRKVENKCIVLPNIDNFDIGGYVFNKNNIFSSSIDHIFNVLPNCFCQKDILDYFLRKLKTIIIDSDTTSRLNAFSTITKLSKILNFNSPKIEDKIYFESKITPFSSPVYQYFPLKISFKGVNLDIEIGYNGLLDVSNIFKKHYYLDGIILNIKTINKINEDLSQSEISYMENLFNNFLEDLELKIKNIKKDKIMEEDVLRLLKVNLDYRNKLNNIIKNNLSYIKQHRPDIVASWKYYQEFEKMCEELDGESKIKQIENNSN